MHAPYQPSEHEVSAEKALEILASNIHEALVRAGGVVPNVPLTGPQLSMLISDMADAINNKNDDIRLLLLCERYKEKHGEDETYRNNHAEAIKRLEAGYGRPDRVERFGLYEHERVAFEEYTAELLRPVLNGVSSIDVGRKLVGLQIEKIEEILDARHGQRETEG